MGELLKLGFEISERTVSRLMPKRRQDPSQTWKTFLINHVGPLVSIDFFTVPKLQLRGLFVFVVLAHERRRILHFNVTQHPTAEWTAQQIIEAFPEDAEPRYLIRDHNVVYGSHFRNRVQGMGIQEVLTAAQSPWQNPFAERLIGSIRRECLNHVIVLGERHLRWTLKDTSATISIRERICRWKRIHRIQDPYRVLAKSSRFHMLVACIIVTSAGSRNAVFRAVESLASQHRWMKPKQAFRRTKSMAVGPAARTHRSNCLIEALGAV